MQTGATALTLPVGEAMTHGVINCPPETPLRTVARMMATHRVHCVAVHGELGWGVVSDLDLIASAGFDVDERTAGHASSSPAITVQPEETLERAAQLMSENETTHLIVVDSVTGNPLGVISTIDIARVLATEQGRFDFGPTS
jgi:CBS domain-containing protein